MCLMVSQASKTLIKLRIYIGKYHGTYTSAQGWLTEPWDRCWGGEVDKTMIFMYSIAQTLFKILESSIQATYILKLQIRLMLRWHRVLSCPVIRAQMLESGSATCGCSHQIWQFCNRVWSMLPHHHQWLQHVASSPFQTSYGMLCMIQVGYSFNKHLYII